MHKVIISDASCLIALENIDQLGILKKLYGQIVTTQTVATEFGNQLPDWIQIQNPDDLLLVEGLEVSLDKGEASAIALAIEVKNCTLIVDDLAARKFAAQLKIEITGTLGILVKAQKSGVLPALRPVMEQLKAVNFRISEKVEQEIYRQTGEN